MKCGFAKNSQKEFRGMSEKYRKRKSHVIRREWHGSFFLRLHRDPPKRIRHGAPKGSAWQIGQRYLIMNWKMAFRLNDLAALGNFVLDLFPHR